MKRGRLVAVVVVLLVASVATPTGLALDTPEGAATDDVATGSLDLGTGGVDEPALAGAADDPDSLVDDGASRDDVDRSVATGDRGPSTVAGPLRAKLPDGDGASTTASVGGSTTKPSIDATSTQPTADDPGTFAPEELVEVVIVSESGQSEAVADAVGARGGQVGGTYADRVAAELPARAIAALAATDAVQHVRQPAEPVNLGTISEGVGRMNATAVHDLGVTGANATIAVVDVEFDPANEKIADQVTATKDLGGGGFSNGTTGLHGTASAEAVADVAPNASLVLVSIGTDSDFFDAVDYLETETDADAATMSLGWYPSAGPLDGTDHLSQRIGESTQRGLLWITSAGNQGEYFGGGFGKHYDRAWTPHDSQTDYMNFDVLGNWETALPVRSFGPGYVYVSWHGDTSGTKTYDVHLYGEGVDGLEHLESSSTAAPYESFYVTGSHDPLYIEIEDVDAEAAHHVDVHTRGNLLLSPAYTVTQSTLIPATSSDAITVAAVDQYDDRIAAYSSRGPTVDGRQGIDVAAPTNVSQIERDAFTGTSAAAPHVGGLAGLLAGAVPNATAADVRWAIESSGRSVSGDRAVVTDDTSNVSIGSGHVDAERAVEILDGIGNVSGSISSAVSGEPVQNATVSVYSGDEPATTISPANASYDASLDAGVYDVEVTADNYRPWTATDVGLEANTTTILDAALGPEDGAIAGSVTEANGTPVENATVGLENVSLPPVGTDANGSFVLDGVPSEREQVIEVRKRAYDGNGSVNATLSPNGSVVRNVTIDRRTHYLGVNDVEGPNDAELDESFAVEGTVVNLGEQRWNATVEYRVNGSATDSENVTLNATSATRVSFDDAIGTEGTYELAIATANETVTTPLSIDEPETDAGGGGGMPMPPPPEPTATADVAVVSASVADGGAVPVGAPVAVDVRLHNAGDADGSIDLALTADGDRVASRTASVPAGATVEETLSVSFDEPGTYALAVDGESAGSIEVREPVAAVPESANGTSSDDPVAEAPADETPGFGVATALLAVVVSVLIARCRP